MITCQRLCHGAVLLKTKGPKVQVVGLGKNAVLVMIRDASARDRLNTRVGLVISSGAFNPRHDKPLATSQRVHISNQVTRLLTGPAKP